MKVGEAATWWLAPSPSVPAASLTSAATQSGVVFAKAKWKASPWNKGKSSFRANLQDSTGGNHDDDDAHHTLPKAFAEQIYKWTRINVNDARYGSWWKRADHLKNAYKYNREWSKFLETQRSRNEILEFGRQMAREYGLTIHF
jgi:hypothetical protein